MWKNYCEDFLNDNPEFKIFNNHVPNEDLCIKTDEYEPKSINEYMIRYICIRNYSIDIYHKIKDNLLPYQLFPTLIQKILQLPIINTYEEFMNINKIIYTDFFLPELNYYGVLNMYHKIQKQYDKDINSFIIYGLFHKNKKCENEKIYDVWDQERMFVLGLERVYNQSFKNGYEALHFVRRWSRYHRIGFLICVSIGKNILYQNEN
jgi:hypothetical protein